MKIYSIILCLLLISQLGISQNYTNTRSLDRRVIADYSQHIDDPYNSSQSYSDSNIYQYSSAIGSKWISVQTNFNNKFMIGEKPKLENLSTVASSRTYLSGFTNSNNIPIPDSTLKWINTFDTNKNLITENIFQWNGVTSTWDSIEKISRTYDTHNNVLSISEIIWSTTTLSWYNSSKNIYTYNANNQMTNEINFRKSMSSTNLDTTFTHKLSYNGSNIETDITLYYINNIIDNGEFITNTYDNSNKIIEKITKEYNNVTSTFNDFEKIIYSYTTNSELTITLNWDNGTNSYLNNYKYEMNTLNGNIFKDGRGYYWDNVANTWQTIPSEMDSAFYDINNKLLKLIVHNGTISSIVEIEINRDSQGKILQYIENENARSDYEYDNYNNIVNIKNYEKNANANWVNYNNEEHYYYETFDNSLGILNVEPLIKFSLYPNPCIKNCYLSYFLNSAIKTTINVLDIYGRTIYTINENAIIGDHLVKLPFDNFNNGIYLVNVYANGSLLSSKKVIKNQ